MPDLEGESASDASDTVPRPDPTVRTEERLRREIAGVEKSFAKDVACINEVMVEKFEGIGRELANLAARTAEQKVDVKEAVVNALQSAKELVFIQQTNTAERLLALGQQIADKGAATDTVLNDLKERVVRIEAGKAGGSEALTSSRETQANIRATILAVAVVLSTIIAVVGFALANKP